MNHLSCETPRDGREAELVYKKVGDREIRLSFRPPVRPVWEKAPVYVVISGGGWHTESRIAMLQFSAPSIEALRRQGYAVASLDYRVRDEAGVFMRQIVNDCFDALRYLAHFAEILNIDPHRIAVSGHSAGAHLALMLAYAPEALFREEAQFSDPFTVRAALPMSAPTILFDGEYPASHNLGDLSLDFSDFSDQQERMAVSPIRYLRADNPPTLLAAGTRDNLVFPISSQLVHEKLQAMGGNSRLILSEGGGHCFEPVEPDTVPQPDMAGVQKALEAFVLEYV